MYTPTPPIWIPPLPWKVAWRRCQVCPKITAKAGCIVNKKKPINEVLDTDCPYLNGTIVNGASYVNV